jgi:AraC-like DNA-binding protein
LDGAEQYWDGDALAAGTGLTRPAGGMRLVLEHRMGIVLTTDDLQPKEREAFWRHVMSDTFAPVTIREMAEGDVAGSIRGHWAGRLLVTEVQSTGQDIRRTPRLISEADNAYFQVAVVASGTGRVSQDDRQAVLHPGDCVLYETTRPFQWLFESDWNVWVFSLPTESVRLSDSERRLISARRLDGTAGLTGIVSRFLLDLARHSEDLPDGQSERVLAHASDLVVTLLSDRLDDTTRVRGAVQRSLMLRVKDYIHQRLCDPALGPAEIAAAVNISTRYLHKLFEADHHTVSLYIKGLRLDRARRDLLDPRLAGRPISAIAYACGFGDLSGFNRAFKQAYAVSPRELRNASTSTAEPRR